MWGSKSGSRIFSMILERVHRNEIDLYEEVRKGFNWVLEVGRMRALFQMEGI